MSEFFIGVLGMFLLYGLGRILYPDMPEHKAIQQELMEDEKDGQ